MFELGLGSFVSSTVVGQLRRAAGEKSTCRLELAARSGRLRWWSRQVGSGAGEYTREVAIIIAHGTGSDEEDSRWVEKITQRTVTAKSTLGLHDIKVFTLREDWFAKRGEAESNIRSYLEEASRVGLKPVVIPFRVHGFGPYTRVLEGLDYRADELGLLPHQNVNLWIANQAELLRKRAERPN